MKVMDMRLGFDGTLLSGDLVLDDVDLQTDEGLQTAIVLSLFTDRRAEDDDELPDGSTDRRGWWGDMLAEDDDDKIGSRLWLLSREKEMAEVVARAEEYGQEAVEWLVTDSIVKAVLVTASVPKHGHLLLTVKVTRFNDVMSTNVYPYQYGAA